MSSVVLLDAGGTIASVPDDAGVLVGRGAAAGLDAMLPPAMRGTVRVESVYSGLSEDLTFANAMRIVRAVRSAAEAGCDGIVVAHGTDTMEDVAFLVSLFHVGPKPVLFTGAQRAGSLPGCDGPANLQDAVMVASTPEAQGIGVAVVFGGRVLPARSVRKIDSSGPEAFGPHGNTIGRVDEFGLRLSAHPRPTPAFVLADPDPNVVIAALGMGSGPEAIDALAASGATALVIEGFGRGNVPMRTLPAIARARAAGILVAIATSCLGGGTAPAYESGARLAELGVIPAEDLSARKLRLLLAVALADGREPASAESLVRQWLAA